MALGLHSQSIRRILVVGGPIAGVLLVLSGPAKGQAANSRCGPAVNITERPTVQELITLGNPDRDHRDFYRSREQRTLPIRIPIVNPNSALPAGEQVSAIATEFSRSDDAQIPADQIAVLSSQVSRNARALEINLCIDPAQPRKVGAGKYVGTLIVDDARFEEKAVPLTINLQDGVLLPAMAVPAGAIIGVIWAGVLAQVKGTQTEEEKRKRRETRKLLYELSVALIVALGAGVAVFIAQYWSDPGWQLDLKSWWTLALSVGAAATAAYPAAALAGRALHERFS